MHHATGETSLKSTQHEDEQSSSVGLTDEELATRGLIKIQAFARATSSVTDSATRAKRARVKAAASGAQQLNVVAPVLAHPTLRTLAKNLQSGASLADVLHHALTAELQKADPSALVKVTTESEANEVKAAGQKMTALALFRAWVSRLRGVQWW